MNILFAGVALILLTGLGAIAWKRVKSYSKKEGLMDPRKWIRNTFYEQANVLLFGDSQIQNWPSSLFGEHSVKNSGRNGGLATSSLSRFKKALANHQPKAVVIEIGVNDILHGIPVESVALAIEKMIGVALNKGIQVKLCAILPMNIELWHRDTHSVKKIIRLNNRIKSLCDRFGAQYVDLYDALSEDDSLPENFTTDGLHLNYDGYVQISKHLFEKTELFGSAPNA